MKAALDCVVIKQGVFNLVFHPYGWIKPEQVVELIDHAVAKHGKKVKFLTFKEALERLNKNLLKGQPLRTADGKDNGVRLRRRRRDGYLEVVQATSRIRRDELEGLKLPPGARDVDDKGRDAGLRFVDLDEDGQLDVVFSNDQEYGIYLFESTKKGWTRKVMAGKAGEPGALPKIVRDGTNNGFFVHSRHLWWQNEDTAKLPDLVDRRSFNDLLEKRRAAGQDARGGAQVDPGRARFHGRAGRDRAAGQGPDRLRLGGRRQALGRRDGRLSARDRRQGEARRRGPVSWKTPMATAGTTSRRPSSTASASRPA